MNDIPSGVTFAIGQVVAGAATISALVFWRSSGLKDSFSFLAGFRRLQRRSLKTARDQALARVGIFRMSVFLFFMAVVAFSLREAYLGGKYASYFLKPETLDASAANVGLQRLLAASSSMMSLTLMATIVAVADWGLSAVLAASVDLSIPSDAIELPHTQYFKGRKYSDIAALWHARIGHFDNDDETVNQQLVRIQEFQVTWEDFARTVCEFRKECLTRSKFRP